MTPAEQDLAREMARHPAWKWLPGYPWISEGATLGEALARAWLAVNGEEPKP